MYSRMDDQVCLITGPTSGIGYVTALEMAKLGAKVVLVGRNQDKCETVKQDILAIGGVEPLIMQCDLSSLEEVKRAANDFLATGLPLHVLFNNAGAINKKRSVTVDGLEQTMAVSYFASFTLTLLLLECIKASAPARIINMATDIYYLGKLNFDDLNFEKKYGFVRAYSTTKLAMIYFTRKLAKLIEGTGVTVNAIHPGQILTNIGVGNNEGLLVKFLGLFWSRFGNSPEEEGHRTSMYAACSDELKNVTGQYIADAKVSELRPIALRDDVAERLWDVSQGITRVSYS